MKQNWMFVVSIRGIYKTGVVEQLNDFAQARVRLPDEDNMLTWWLQIEQPKTFGDQFVWLPDIGQEVSVIMDERFEAGMVIGGFYSQNNPPPVTGSGIFHVTFKDGAIIEYNRDTHALKVLLPDGGTGEITCPAGLTINADQTIINGKLQVNGEQTNAETIVADGNIESKSQIKDSKSTVDKLRSDYNAHTGHGTAPAKPPKSPN
jgi:phage baseplate assembly protein V